MVEKDAVIVVNDTDFSSSRKRWSKASSAKSNESAKKALESKTKIAITWALENKDGISAFWEFIGTFLFLFLALTSVQTAFTLDTIKPEPLSPLTVLFISTAFGLSLMTAIAMVGDVSGGHLNPAVSLSLAASGHIPFPRALLYILAQCAGASLAAAIADALTAGPLIGVNKIGQDFRVMDAFIFEMLLTFILVLTVFKTAVHTKMNPVCTLY